MILGVESGFFTNGSASHRCSDEGRWARRRNRFDPSTALFVVLTASRRRGCAVGFFMLNAGDVQPGVGDGVEGAVEGVILVRELVEDAEFAQHRNVLGLRSGEQDPGASAFKAPDRFREHPGAGGVDRRDVAHAQHDNLDP